MEITTLPPTSRKSATKQLNGTASELQDAAYFSFWYQLPVLLLTGDRWQLVHGPHFEYHSDFCRPLHRACTHRPNQIQHFTINILKEVTPSLLLKSFGQLLLESIKSGSCRSLAGKASAPLVASSLALNSLVCLQR